MSEGLACFLVLRVVQQLVRVCQRSRPTSVEPPKTNIPALSGDSQHQVSTVWWWWAPPSAN